MKAARGRMNRVSQARMEPVRLGRSLRGSRRAGLRRIWAGALLCLGVLVLGGCSDDDKGTDPEPDGPPYDDGRLTFPLSVGNEWTYEAADSSGVQPRGESFNTRIVGTRSIGGASYFSVVDNLEGFSDTTYIRQEGSNVFLYPAAFLRPPEDPLMLWLQQNVGDTLPWRVIDFEATGGESWLIGEAEGAVEFGEISASVAGSVRVEALGTMPVSSPAGDFDTAFRFRVTLDVDIETTAPLVPERVQSVQTLSVVDDVGIVRDENEDTVTIEGSPATTRAVLVLQSFDVAAP